MFEKWRARFELKKLKVSLRPDEVEPMCYQVFISGKKSKLYVRSSEFGRWYCHKRRKQNPFSTYNTPEEATLNEFLIQCLRDRTENR